MDLARKDLLLQHYGERIEKLLQQDRLSGQEYGGPHGRSPTGGGGLARVPNLRVCEHLPRRLAHAGGEG